MLPFLYGSKFACIPELRFTFVTNISSKQTISFEAVIIPFSEIQYCICYIFCCIRCTTLFVTQAELYLNYNFFQYHWINHISMPIFPICNNINQINHLYRTFIDILSITFSNKHKRDSLFRIQKIVLRRKYFWKA